MRLVYSSVVIQSIHGHKISICNWFYRGLYQALYTFWNEYYLCALIHLILMAILLNFMNKSIFQFNGNVCRYKFSK